MRVKDYLRQRFLPHIWCPGCGHGIVTASLIRAIIQLGLAKSEVVVISGIGCSSRIAGYLDFHTMHTLHGRALAFATGVKMGRPDLKVIVPMGDGDAMAIGGNHLIHTARRNIDVTAIVMNNNIYGMTGGQASPTTPQGSYATTAPDEVQDPAFDPVELVRGAGASFIARGTTYHVRQLQQLLAKAIAHPGFSFVEVLSQCPTYFGRKNRGGTAAQMMKQMKLTTVPVGSPKASGDDSLVPRGVIVERTEREYSSNYMDLAARLEGEG